MMKRILCALMCLIGVSVFAVDYRCNSLTDVRESIEKAKDKGSYGVLTLKVTESELVNPSKTFEELCAVVDRVFGRNGNRDLFKRQYVLYKRDDLMQDMWKLCLSHPTVYDFQIVCRKAKLIGMTAEAAYDWTYDDLVKNISNYAVRDVRIRVEYLIDNSYLVSEDKVRSYFKVLNRMVSQRLADSKKDYEPIVAKIRITMDLYK